MSGKDQKDPFGRDSDEYMGNIWGWKFSYISLAIILVMVLLMWYRHSNLSPEELDRFHLEQKMNQDSLKKN